MDGPRMCHLATGAYEVRCLGKASASTHVMFLGVSDTHRAGGRPVVTEAHLQTES